MRGIRPHHPLILAVAVALAGCTWLFGPRPPARFEGYRLVDPFGMTLYVNDRDVAWSGQTTCTSACLEDFRPYIAAPDSRRVGDFTRITRADGTLQWAFRGKPLYRFARDVRPGDQGGHGFDNLWRAAVY